MGALVTKYWTKDEQRSVGVCTILLGCVAHSWCEANFQGDN